ncbi:MAG: hypothetical protein JKY01_08965 [Pseudomonadales bacterium]|nr:hypothetical protein [Pseudomonadales bacterium]
MKKLFNKLRGKSASKQSKLEHPRQLSVGDLMQLDDSFALPALLRGAMLEVLEVNTSQFEFNHEPEWILKGESEQSVFFSISEEDGESYAAFSIKIERADVDALFDMDQFSSIFDDESLARLDAKTTEGALAGWLAESYEQDGQSERGYFYREDYRASQPPSTEGSGEPFDCYCLSNEDDTHALEIEVWGSGDTDVLLTLYRPLSDIRELWPSRKAGS